MPPSGLAIIIGAGPSTDNLTSLKASLQESNPDATIETFPTDTSPGVLSKTSVAIKSHGSFAGLKLEIAVYGIKHAEKKPFLEETHEAFTSSLTTYVGGAMAFGQESIKRFLEDHGKAPLAEGGGKKGTLIFTGTLGALRTNPTFASYGAGRSGVRMLAQALAKEFSPLGVHVVHTIMNGGIKDENGEEQVRGKSMSADAVDEEYLHLAKQKPTLWTHELDTRPAQEKF